MKIRNISISILIIGLIILFSNLLVKRVFSANSTPNKSSSTFSFGGKILSTSISGVVCKGLGTGPILLSSNIGGAAKVVNYTTDNSETGQKVTGSITGVYKMIPFYATDPNKTPKVGGQILGRADIIPDFSICSIPSLYNIPFPVRKTSNYGVSPNNDNNKQDISGGGNEGGTGIDVSATS